VIDPAEPRFLSSGIATNDSILFVADSHLWCFSRTSWGKFLDCAPSDNTTVDRFIEQAPELSASGQTGYARIAPMSASPAEQLVTLEAMLAKGLRPRGVVVGLRWNSGVSPPLLRPEYQALLSDPAVGDRVRADLAAVDVDRGLTGALFARSQVERPSWIDERESAFEEWASRDLPVLGDRRALRMAFARGEITLQRAAGFTSYQAPSSAFWELKVESLTALLRLLQKADLPRLCYLPPEQLGLMAEYSPELVALGNATVARITRAAAATGCPVVDARSVVPQDMFGWNAFGRDAYHMTEAGHSVLARFIYESGRELGTWEGFGHRAVH
jgi:hypothetical protein